MGDLLVLANFLTTIQHWWLLVNIIAQELKDADVPLSRTRALVLARRPPSRRRWSRRTRGWRRRWRRPSSSRPRPRSSAAGWRTWTPRWTSSPQPGPVSMQIYSTNSIKKSSIACLHLKLELKLSPPPVTEQVLIISRAQQGNPI